MANTIAEPDTRDLNETETETQDEGQWRLKRRKEGGILDHKGLIYTLYPRFALRCLHLQTMFQHNFETADYLALHWHWGLEFFTEDVCTHDIYYLNILERDSKICVLRT